MIVESHSHIHVDLGPDYGPNNLYGMQVDSVDSYLGSYERNNVDACCVFGLRGFFDSAVIPRENEGLAALARKYPQRLFPWGTVNPNWPEKYLRDEIRRIAVDLKLYGLKFVPIVQGFPLSGPGMDIVADQASQLNLPIFLHDGSPEYCSAIQVAYFARKFPKVRVVSGHGGIRELWPDLIPAAKELPNLWICLSGPTQWGIQKLYDELGPEKLFFGSDGGLGHWAVIKAYLRRIERLRAPENHKDMILGLNVMKFLFGESWQEKWTGLSQQRRQDAQDGLSQETA